MALKAPERSSSRKSAPSRLSYLKSPSLCIFLPFSLFLFYRTGKKELLAQRRISRVVQCDSGGGDAKVIGGCRCQQERACTGPAGPQRLDAILLPAIMLPFHGI